MPERYVGSIVKYLSDRDYQPLKARQLARRMGVAESDYAAFRNAVKQLKDEGRVVLGPKNALALPPLTDKVVGTYRANPRGFGFVVPDEANAHGDLFIPEGESGDAMTGDKVVARVLTRGKRDGKTIFHGRIIEVVERGTNRVVGELRRAEDNVWFMYPQGRSMVDPVVIDDIGPSGKPGVKVVVEIVHYPRGTELARGVIVETLGAAGPIDVETLSVIREYGLPDEFSPEALDHARRVTAEFDPDADPDRKDFTGWPIVTIDPDDARDYDDAISIKRTDKGYTLGVHIADVSSFVTDGSPLDVDARQRGNSVYFPRKVVPMLPEILSNGLCSLQEAQVRHVKSAIIDYDREGNVVGRRYANAKIRSKKRLTYTQAQGIIDGKVGDFDEPVVRLVQDMNTLARLIEARRRKAGMVHLDLPEVELVLDDAGRVADAVKADDSYSHTIIEMFMVEANDAVAVLLDNQDVPFLRRVHPEGDTEANKHLRTFVRACGLKVPADLSRFDMQALVASVRGRPESYAVNLALLKTFQRAEYSPMRVGHFALASENYCHFTSPIRRYPDLTVHRLLDAYLRGRLNKAEIDEGEVVAMGEHCSVTERRAERAERDLRALLVLQLLATRIGETVEGVVTGITSFGLFIESTKYLVEGLVRLADLGDDWWESDPQHGTVTAQRTGRQIRMGDVVTARIVAVDLARRQMDLRIEKLPNARGKKQREKAPREKSRRGKSAGGKKAGGKVGKKPRRSTRGR